MNEVLFSSVTARVPGVSEAGSISFCTYVGFSTGASSRLDLGGFAHSIL